ncbi:hypothetical protein MEG_01778 [Bartonella tamiae Th307]|uniref:MOFRL domain-containing protein n=1 Tax=Bartonella tamiae Th239 TaxID=1094558 RepID=J0R7L4_9HYPH|nr:hypothetical protein ME5_00103 [Bartonella tamiae Th239]EJF92608.1 hypothetical protein MEG_01778 [Bartonella tamiae Th307]
MMEKHLPKPPLGKTIVVGAGKGAAQMAAFLEQTWQKKGYPPLQGAVVTRYGYGCQTTNIEVLEAAHPVPDENGLKASQIIMKLVENLHENDLVITLISGGGSALLPAPCVGLTLEDEILINDALLKSGAPIGVMNTIRKQFSQIKGGRLAALAAPAKVVTFIVSDIPGDFKEMVASGPTIADRSTSSDARQFIEYYNIDLPKHIMNRLEKSDSKNLTADDPIFKTHESYIVASAAKSLDAAAAYARKKGVEAVILSDSIEGEAKDIGSMHAALAKNIANNNQPFQKPIVLLSGGETSVTLFHHSKDIAISKSKGGRNSKFLLAFALAIKGEKQIFALAADTDGSEDNAGAFCDGYSVYHMQKKGYHGEQLLKDHNAWVAFYASDDLFVTGPTGTNVNDFRAILITDEYAD